MVEPVSVVVHAISRADKLAVKRVVVLGAGPIGNLVAQVVSAEGAQALITDLSDHRLEVAHQCGLKHTSNSSRETLKEAARTVFGLAGFEVAFECVRVEATMTAAIDSIEKAGTIIVVGVCGEKPHVDLGLVQDRELNLHGTLMYKREDYERSVELASGKINCVVLNNGVRMPWLGFGVFQMQPGMETEQSVRIALETGYRSLDTAAIYGVESYAQIVWPGQLPGWGEWIL